MSASNCRFLMLLCFCFSAAWAEDGQKVITQYNCMACHASSKKIVGPSYQDIAAKYRGQKDAELLISKAIRNGVQGKWGKIPMPPQQINDADLQLVSRWVLKQ